MAYQLLDENTVLRLADNTCIPFDSANADYRQYCEWCTIKGNKPAPIPTITEAELSPLQKLQASGLTLEELQALLAL